jgi:hypothetical protein
MSRFSVHLFPIDDQFQHGYKIQIKVKKDELDLPVRCQPR